VSVINKTIAIKYLGMLDEYAHSLLINKEQDIQTLVAGLIVILKQVLEDKIKHEDNNETPYI